MLFLSLIACAEPEKEPEPVEETDTPHVMNVWSDPTQVDFGLAELGAPVTRVVTVHNDGTANATLTAAIVDDDAITVEAPTSLPIAPGATADVTLTWTPTVPATLADTLEILLVGSELRQLQLPVTGTGAGPSLSLSATGIDFGTVTAGCTSSIPLTLSNGGSDDLVIDAASLDGTSTITLGSAAGELPPTPWTIPAGSAQELVLHFTPVDERTVSTRLHLSTNDPVTPTVDADVYGKGYVEAENSITYEAIRAQNITMLVALNYLAVRDSRLEETLPTLFETLQSTGSAFRVAFFTGTDGAIVGEEPYIDETFTTDEAMETFEEMISEINRAGDNDYLLQSFGNSIVANRAWLLDESVYWEDAHLSLIAANSDQEQSSGDYMTHLLNYWGYKADPANITVNAIAGEIPRGCSGGSVYAEPSQALFEAASASGGVFCSWCSDWNGCWEEMANDAKGDPTGVFLLEGTPAEWSIVVRVDGVLVTTGWAYDASQNAVVFEDGLEPEVGAQVRIDYIYAAECP